MQNSGEHLVVAVSPHRRAGLTSPQMMWGVLIALVPALACGVFFFGLNALLLALVSIAASMATEVLCQLARRKPVTVSDGSAVLTGVLLAMILPPGFPLGAAALGAVVAVALGKHLFGGLGSNTFNPALIGRAFLAAAFPVWITLWPDLTAQAASVAQNLGIDAVTGPTPLAAIGEGTPSSALALFLGFTKGSMGETSAAALLIGGIYIFVRGYADLRLALSMLATVGILSLLLQLTAVSPEVRPLYDLFAGGLMIGAIFMATDPVTSPVTNQGKWIFGIGAGVLIVLIRRWGAMPEGVMYSILLMNSVTPLLNRWTCPRPFGAPGWLGKTRGASGG